MSKVTGLSRLSAVLGLAALSTGSLFMMAAQPADKPAERPAPREGQPAGQPGGGQPGERGPGRGGPRGGGGGAEFANVEQAMKAINGGYRELKRNVADTTKKTSNLAAVAQMQRGSLFSKNNTPNHLKGGEKSLEDYRRAQISLMRMLLDLETQILDGKTDDATKSLEAIHDFEESQHAKFIEENKPAEKPAGDKPAPETKR
jgi:hypothetical protein